MTGRLAGKTALVTGAGQGIGRATAEAFAKEGARVVATDSDGEKLKVFEGIAGIEIRTLDVTDQEAIEELSNNIDTLDILFNCVGYVHHGTILECRLKDWQQSFDINVTSMYFTCQQFLPKMLHQGHGVIINMSSVASVIKGCANRFAYATTKAAVIGLTKSIAIDYVQRGIRCNCICPGTVDTPSFHDRVNAAEDPSQALKDMIARQKMGRVGKAEEIAMLCVYLASDESSYTTGTEFIIDGGWTL